MNSQVKKVKWLNAGLLAIALGLLVGVRPIYAQTESVPENPYDLEACNGFSEADVRADCREAWVVYDSGIAVTHVAKIYHEQVTLSILSLYPVPHRGSNREELRPGTAITVVHAFATVDGQVWVQVRKGPDIYGFIPLGR